MILTIGNLGYIDTDENMFHVDTDFLYHMQTSQGMKPYQVIMMIKEIIDEKLEYAKS